MEAKKTKKQKEAISRKRGGWVQSLQGVAKAESGGKNGGKDR